MIKLINNDCLIALKEMKSNSVDSIVTDPPYGISFMGKKWDYDVPSVELWKEVLRVLKPGGHALVACGTRTQHRMAVNLEDAGFEIRDIVAWVYGSGFPKSLNIGKAVDKLQGNEREEIEKVFPDGSKPRKTQHIDFFTEKEGIKGNAKYTKGNSPYEGWGTALKPSMELWTLCRKPLEEKTVAENVLKYGTGGLNIDGCRVEGTYDNSGRNIRNEDYTSNSEFLTALSKEGRKTRADSNSLGRFPANLIHDGSDEVVGLFPETKPSRVGKPRGTFKKGMFANSTFNKVGQEHNDSGSASRFFYCAKASKSERNRGLEGFEEVRVSDGRKTEHHVPNLRTTPKQNFHPTVKPVKLMQYLCRLITPKGGTVLDPFTGSGSTGIGAKLEGFDFIGIEREEDYCKIAEARIESYEKENKLFDKHF